MTAPPTAPPPAAQPPGNPPPGNPPPGNPPPGNPPPDTQPPGTQPLAGQPELPPPAAEPGRASTPAAALLRLWRRARYSLLVLALVTLCLTVTVLAAPAAKSNAYLDPADASATGTKALAEILAQRGFAFTSTYRPSAALAAVAAARQHQPGSAVTLVITSPDLLTAAQRQQLASAAVADLVLVEPGSAALRSLAPAVRVVSTAIPTGQVIEPACTLPAAELAGAVQAGGITYQPPGGATGCYPVRQHPSVVKYAAGRRMITIIGNGLLLSDGQLASDGNAALALNLLGAHAPIIWLTPEPNFAVPGHRQATRSRPALIPPAAWLVVLELLVALALTILWRSRRFGPLIAERLPVVVRASETVEGHARLYQSRRARDQAAAALREAMLGRVKPALGLAADAPPDAVVDGLASRSGQTSQQIESTCYGAPPRSDPELVTLAHDLDELEREVRSQ